MTDDTTTEMVKRMAERNWIAESSNNGIWVVGPQTSFGLNALGLGRTFLEAFQMAERSAECASSR